MNSLEMLSCVTNWKIFPGQSKKGILKRCVKILRGHLLISPYQSVFMNHEKKGERKKKETQRVPPSTVI